MKKLVNVSMFSLAVLAGVTLFSCNAQTKADLKTDVDSVSYAQGFLYSSQVEQIFQQLELDDTQKADFLKGFKEGLNIDAKKNKGAVAQLIGQLQGYQMGTQGVPYFNQELFGNDSTQTVSLKNILAGYTAGVKGDSTAAFTLESAQAYVMEAMAALKEKALEKQFADVKKANVDYLAANKSKAGVITTASGLQYTVDKESTGEKPTAADFVKVDYEGTNINGEVFDANNGAEFGVGQVIKGWTEGLQLMSVGSTYTFYIPYDLAYGAEGRGEKISPFATLIFKVTLHEIVKK